MQIAITLLIFAGLAAAISWYGYRVYAKPGRVYERLSDKTDDRIERNADIGYGLEDSGPFVQVVHHIGQKVPLSPADVTQTRRYLIAAGYRSDAAVPLYYGLKVLSAAALALLAVFLRFQMQPAPALGLIMILLGAAGGWFLPGIVLEMLVRRRQETLRLSLPDALDLMVVCVEAGHGLDQAMVRVSKELELTHKDICEELGLVNLEMRAGKRRAEALHNLAERTGEPELRKLVAVMIQADRFGTGIAESLRTHAEFMRIRRRQMAEERAGKVGVKLVFPLALCILPSIFIVSGGSAFIQVYKELLPLLGKGN
jgi:tight adherence protein C